MKKLILSLFILTCIFLSSCSKDYTNPDDLNGTTWKFDGSNLEQNTSLEYALLVFTSRSVVEGWSKEFDQDQVNDWIGTYNISGETIVVNYDDNSISNNSFSGVISDETINCTISNVSYLFELE